MSGNAFDGKQKKKGGWPYDDLSDDDDDDDPHVAILFVM